MTKTRLYNFDPLKLHFYIVKLGFRGVYIIFLISAQNISCWFSLTSTHNLCFEEKHEKYQNFYLKIFNFLVVKFLVYLKRYVFVMEDRNNEAQPSRCIERRRDQEQIMTKQNKTAPLQ